MEAPGSSRDRIQALAAHSPFPSDRFHKRVHTEVPQGLGVSSYGRRLDSVVCSRETVQFGRADGRDGRKRQRL